MLSLPLAFLALVPSGSVSPLLYDVIRGDLRAVPVQADAGRDGRALNDSGGTGAAPLLHLARACSLGASGLAAAGSALRRFALTSGRRSAGA